MQHTDNAYLDAILRELRGMSSVSGSSPIPLGANQVDVFFSDQGGSKYRVQACVENTVDPDPLVLFVGTIVDKTGGGFRAALSGRTDSGNYRINWSLK